MRELTVDQLINQQYKSYSMHVLESRAICSVIDGLKPVIRRGLWCAMKYNTSNDLIKVVKLAGIALALHPHSNKSLEDCISGNAQGFTGANNVPWFIGKGGFGSKVSGPGNGIASARYISVKLSEHFFKLLGVDKDLIPTVPSYDDGDIEPKYFLPIVPTVLLNPSQGIAVGFASNILPRKLDDIVHCQLQHLEGKSFHEPKVYYEGFKGEVVKIDEKTWKTYGVYTKYGRKLTITELPIGITREDYVKILDNLEDKEVITSFSDECTDEFLFTVNLKDENLPKEEIIEKFKLFSLLNENLNVIGFDGKIRNMNVSEIIKEFTDYRLKFYYDRFKKEFFELKETFEFKRDLLKVIQKGLFKKFPEMTKQESEKFLISESISESNIQRIVQTPIYKFNKDEVEKIKTDLSTLKDRLQRLSVLCKDENERKDEYKKELKTI